MDSAGADGIGATAVQIAEYDGGRRKNVAHVGSARTAAELGAWEVTGSTRRG